MAQTYSLKQLEEKANTIREDIIRMLEHAGSGHSAGPLGLADIRLVVALARRVA
jgi:transketolase